MGGLLCSNCGIPCTDLHVTENMCNTCFLYWKKTGAFRPLTGPLKRGERQTLGALRQRRCPPKGMFINHDDLNTLASSTPQAENVTLQGLEKAVLDEKCKVQIKKQEIEILKRSLPSDGMAKFKRNKDQGKQQQEMVSNSGSRGSSNGGRVTSRWSQDELRLAAQGVRGYGRYFQKIADVIGTKTEVHMKWFYTTHRKRFNLDQLIQDYDAENEGDSAKSKMSN